MQVSEELVKKANAMCLGTMLESLGLVFGMDGAGRMTATMPVDARTVQPAGLLHGGATAALCESLGSLSSALLIGDAEGVVGIEVNANHLKGVRSGTVTATGELVHHGRTTHVWDIRVRNDAGELVAICRLTNLIIPKRK